MTDRERTSRLETLAATSVAAMEAMVGPDPSRPGPARARLLAEQIPVWTIIGYAGAVGGSPRAGEISAATIAEVAEAYDISEVAVIAALLYYDRHCAAIDTVLQTNAAITD